MKKRELERAKEAVLDFLRERKRGREQDCPVSASYSEIGRAVCFSAYEVCRATEILEEKGYIEVSGQRQMGVGAPNHYIIKDLPTARQDADELHFPRGQAESPDKRMANWEWGVETALRVGRPTDLYDLVCNAIEPWGMLEKKPPLFDSGEEAWYRVCVMAQDISGRAMSNLLVRAVFHELALKEKSKAEKRPWDDFREPGSTWVAEEADVAEGEESSRNV